MNEGTVYLLFKERLPRPNQLAWTRWLDASFVHKLEVQVSFDHLLAGWVLAW
jgi:hypothetical protein